MSVIVKSIDQNNKKMTLDLDNGYLTKLQEAMEKWSFKNHQSLLQFMVSLLLLNGRSSFEKDYSEKTKIEIVELQANKEVQKEDDRFFWGKLKSGIWQLILVISGAILGYFLKN